MDELFWIFFITIIWTWKLRLCVHLYLLLLIFSFIVYSFFIMSLFTSETGRWRQSTVSATSSLNFNGKFSGRRKHGHKDAALISCSWLYIFLLLLVADTQLYKRLCPSIGPSIGPSVRPSVRRFVCGHESKSAN